MDLTLDIDDLGRLVSTLADARGAAMIAASDVLAAADDFEQAFERVRIEGRAECIWRVPAGDYRWIFRRVDDRLIVVLMWSAGTVTGWQVLFRAECGLEEFAGQVRSELSRLRAGGAALA
jgi:hypothetical protein